MNVDKYFENKTYTAKEVFETIDKIKSEHNNQLEEIAQKMHETIALYGKNDFTLEAEIIRHLENIVRGYKEKTHE